MMSQDVLKDVLGPRATKELWGAGYRPVLPVNPQDFELGGVLPAILYLMRWGHRRGLGRFEAVYGDPDEVRKRASISDVACRLGTPENGFQGFASSEAQAVLGDLLLAYCLENVGHRTGREEQIQRVFASHYLASWVDLPKSFANLRGVPEMIVALLARQPEGAAVGGGGKGFFAVGTGFEGNLLLSIFGSGMSIQDDHNGVRSDRFAEETSVGIDQLLAIRLAQSLGEAPLKARGENPLIPNQQPLAQRAASIFHEDVNVFVRAYGRGIPRQSLLPLLESAFAIGITNIYLSTLRILLHWAETGKVLPTEEQEPWPLFVDCSLGAEPELRRISEESFDDLVQRLARMPVCMMCLRILNQFVTEEGLSYPEANPAPDPTAHVAFLGCLITERLEESRDLTRDLRKRCNSVAKALEEPSAESLRRLLTNNDVHPAWRLAEALVAMMGDKLQLAHYRKFLDAGLMVNEPHGIGRKRKSSVKGRQNVDRRSLVLTNTALDFLVHRHLRGANRGTRPADLSLRGFIGILRDRYGFCVDQTPPGLSIPEELLQRNRAFLERRLRDLGLFVGVNDAESMKRLKPRFAVEDADAN